MKDRSNFKIIEDYPNYAVNSLGEIKRISKARGTTAGKILKTYGKKYPALRLGDKDGKFHMILISRLVLGTWVGPSERDTKHRDGNTANNVLSNLYYEPFKNRTEYEEHHRIMTFWIPNELHNEMKEYCSDKPITMSDFIRSAIKKRLKKKEGYEPSCSL